MIHLRPVQAADADQLYPLLNHAVTDTILWDGPESLESFRLDTARRAEQAARGEIFSYTVVENSTSLPIGRASLRPDEERFGAEIGLFIGRVYWGRGFGTQTVAELVRIGFESLGLEKIEADIFLGNWASRRIFEKNGFRVEGTIRSAVRKRGRAMDEWRVGLTRADWQTGAPEQAGPPENWLVHLCTAIDWQAAQYRGEYRPPSLEAEGFIHLSAPEKALRSANRYFAGKTDLLALWVDARLLTAPLYWELAEEYRYPHLYGPLNLAAVQAVFPLHAGEGGSFTSLPTPPK